MKKAILLSLVVSSFLVGENTVNALTINQESEITSGSTIDNATVHQGKTDILGTSDVDDVLIKQNGPNNGNLIENSDITGKYTGDISVLQGLVTISGADSHATNLTLESSNLIKNVEILNSLIEQGSFTITDANATDTSNTNTELNSINIVERVSVDAGVDINATEIKQGVTILSAGAITDNFTLKHLNKITASTVKDAQVHQAILNVNDSEVNNLAVSDSDGAANSNTVNTSTIEGGFILQSSIDISNDSVVETLIAKSTNLIDASTSTNSNISQSETTIN